MKKSVYLFLVFLLFLSGATYYYVVHIKDVLELTSEKLEEKQLAAFSVKDEFEISDTSHVSSKNWSDSVHVASIYTDGGITIYYDELPLKNILTKEITNDLRLTADSLSKAQSGANIIVHTDNGSDNKSQFKLGQNLAEKIERLFLEEGVTTERLRSSSMGSTQPIADNSTKGGRALNRRIIIIYND